MRKLEKKLGISKKQWIVTFFVNLIVLLPLIVFGGETYNNDSYVVAVDYNFHLTNFIGSYRFFGALVYYINLLC